MQETYVWSLGGKIPWRRAWQPSPVFLPGESPWTEEPEGLQSVESQRVGHDWVTKHSTEWILSWKLPLSSWPPHEVSPWLLLCYRVFCERKNSKINCNGLETLGGCSLTLFYISSEPEHSTLKKKKNKNFPHEKWASVEMNGHICTDRKLASVLTLKRLKL